MGSIRRKVRGKSSQSTISIPEATYEETTKNQDDFLKAAMKIFLVVSPPMGRIQVKIILANLELSFIHTAQKWFNSARRKNA